MIERFWLFHYAWGRLPQSAVVEKGGWQQVRVPILGGLAVHSRLGPILLDVPYGREGPSNLGMLLGSMLETMGLNFQSDWSVVPRLEQIGFRAADVEHVLMTHLHCDHTGGMKTLAHATFHLSRREWEYAREGPGAQAKIRGYVRDDFAALGERVELYDSLPHPASHAEGLDVFGDGSVEMFELPGHTPGHCGYRLRSGGQKAIFFAGDAAGSVPELLGDCRPGWLPRALAESHTAVELTQRGVRRHLEQHPADTPVVCHDPELGERCLNEGPVVWQLSPTPEPT